jgi:hypothetical protein
MFGSAIAAFQVRRNRRRTDTLPPAAGQVQLALKLDVASRGLVRVLLADLVEDVVVELVEGDPSVLVPVSITGGQPLDQGSGKHRRLRLVIVREMFSLKCVLHRAGGGDHRPAAPAACSFPREAVQHVDIPGRAHRDALGEGTPVAAVQQQHDAVRPAVPHAAPHEVRRDGRGAEPVRAGVRGGEKSSPDSLFSP